MSEETKDLGCVCDVSTRCYKHAVMPALELEAVVESNEILQEENSRLRNSNRVLRQVVRALRATVTTMRTQVELAKENDDVFKAFCNGEFDVKGTDPSESGLLEPGT
jgi:DNA-binding ferritin-like protein